MSLKILAALLAASHVITIGLIVLWFGVGKPKTAKEFWTGFKREFLTLSPHSR